MLLIDLSHTSHTAARTGVQRVCRSLYQALARRSSIVPITHDPHRGGWRELEEWERRQLAAVEEVAQRRRAQWPLRARWRGRFGRWLGRPQAPLPTASAGVLVPEIFSPAVAEALPTLRQAGRPLVAIFHDAIALRLPEFTPAKTVARFPSYLQELRAFDGIAAVSDDSRQALIDYWGWLGWPDCPPVVTLPLGTDPSPPPPSHCHTMGDMAAGATVLCVGSIEGRKNHLALLNACERLWSAGRRFRLRLVGMPRPETAQQALDRLRDLQTQGRPVQFDGAATDAQLVQAYHECTFTVYPSLMEGFGLPVIESLRFGRPCLCSGAGALGETARGGGCLTLERLDDQSIAAALDRLLQDEALQQRLRSEAAERHFKSWDDYAGELLGWMRSLRPRD